MRKKLSMHLVFNLIVILSVQRLVTKRLWAATRIILGTGSRQCIDYLCVLSSNDFGIYFKTKIDVIAKSIVTALELLCPISTSLIGDVGHFLGGGSMPGGRGDFQCLPQLRHSRLLM